MNPPPAELFASRVLLGPALRTQPDRRLVRLVRDGYEAAFEEIVRRYRKPLDRFAAAIVGGRSEDVIQDAFSKALLALRGSDAEIELKPWLYRIVRNTALNDLRDGPPAAAELAETMPGGVSAAAAAERREEIAELMSRLRALPEPQRAAIVMRELEGLSHEEIAAALGVSGGAARQAIYRARAALRDGLGLLVPLPLVRVLFDHGAEAAGAGGATAATAAATAPAGGGGALGALGTGGAIKAGAATALIVGSLGAGVAIQHDRGEPAGGPASAAAASLRAPGGAAASDDRGNSGHSSGGEDRSGGRGGGAEDGGHGRGSGHSGDDSRTSAGEVSSHRSPHSGPGGGSGGSHDGGRGGGDDGHSGSGRGAGDRSGEDGGPSGGSGSPSGHHGSGDSGGGGSSDSGSGSGSGSGGSPDDGVVELSGDSGSGGPGSGDSGTSGGS
jgi:RNA polymerase sigma factor (sigma-70 family)